MYELSNRLTPEIKYPISATIESLAYSESAEIMRNKGLKGRWYLIKNGKI